MCSYCWARKLQKTRLKHLPQYRDFKPKLVESQLGKVPNAELIFVSDRGDILCEGVKDEWIGRVIEIIKKYSDRYFLLLTKNPVRYFSFLDKLPDNMILGSTIELI